LLGSFNGKSGLSETGDLLRFERVVGRLRSGLDFAGVAAFDVRRDALDATNFGWFDMAIDANLVTRFASDDLTRVNNNFKKNLADRNATHLDRLR